MPFRFFAPWVLHEAFPRFMKDHWNKQISWKDSVSYFKDNLSVWNINTFGHIQRTTKKLFRRMNGLNRKMARLGSLVSLKNDQ